MCERSTRAFTVTLALCFWNMTVGFLTHLYQRACPRLTMRSEKLITHPHRLRRIAPSVPKNSLFDYIAYRRFQRLLLSSNKKQYRVASAYARPRSPRAFKHDPCGPHSMPSYPGSTSTFVEVANFYQTTIFACLGIVNVICETALRVVPPAGLTHAVHLLPSHKEMTVGRSEN